MRVQWEVQDGYAGKSRPQFTDIPDEELEGLSEEERQLVIEDYVQSEFEALGWYIVGYTDD